MSDGIIRIDRRLPPGSSYRMTAEDLMLAAARMQRDGMTRDQIRRELEFDGPTAYLDRFLDRSRELLAQRIAEGVEPEESVVQIDLNDLATAASLGYSSPEEAKADLLTDDISDAEVMADTDITSR